MSENFLTGIAELIGETMGTLAEVKGRAFLSAIVLDSNGNPVYARVISVGENEAGTEPLATSLMDLPRKGHPGQRLLGMVIFAPVATGGAS